MQQVGLPWALPIICRAKNNEHLYGVVQPLDQLGEKIFRGTGAKKGTKDASDGTKDHFAGHREREDGAALAGAI